MDTARKILVVAAHADDEVLGIGGTISRHSAEGDEVSMLFMTNGVGSRETGNKDDIARRRSACENAAEILGASIHSILDYPDNGMDQVPLLSICKEVRSAVEQLQPDIVYTHFAGDLNIDHQIAQRATLTALRPQPGERVTEILAYSVLSATEWSHLLPSSGFIPDTFVDVSAHLNTLIRAAEAYAEELRPFPHARSIEAIEARVRYFGAVVGVSAAEPLQTIRRIHRANSNSFA